MKPIIMSEGCYLVIVMVLCIKLVTWLAGLVAWDDVMLHILKTIRG